MQEKNLGELKKRGKVVGKKKEMPGLETKVSGYYEAVSSMTLHLAMPFTIHPPISPLKDLYPAVHPTGKKIILRTNVNTPWEMDEIKYGARVSLSINLKTLVENHFSAFSKHFLRDQSNKLFPLRPF